MIPIPCRDWFYRAHTPKQSDNDYSPELIGSFTGNSHQMGVFWFAHLFWGDILPARNW